MEYLRSNLYRVQLRTAVHILVRRVHQLSKVIVEAEKEIPPLSNEDEEFLDRILGTLGLADAPPYQAGSVDRRRQSSKSSPLVQQSLTPISPVPQAPVPQTLYNANVGSVPPPTLPQDNVPDMNYPVSDFDDVAGILASMNTQQQTTQSPGSNLVLNEDHISPDWPFPTLDNMLNFDLFDAGDLPMQFLAEPQGMLFPPPPQEIPPPPQANQESANDDALSSGDEESTELVTQLSARLGSLRLAPDGKLRYFGTTSNLHLIESGSKSGENFMLHTPSRINKQRLLEVADLNQAVDLQLEDHLLRLFFTWHNPSSYIVDEEAFYMARQSWMSNGVQNSYYNDVLKDAM